MEKEITKSTVVGFVIGGIIGFLTVSIVFYCIEYLFSCIV